MTKEYRIVIRTMSGPDISIPCEDETELKRRAAGISDLWVASLQGGIANAIVQIQGEHGMHSIPAPLIARIDPVVKEPKEPKDLSSIWKLESTATAPASFGSPLTTDLLSEQARRMMDHSRDEEE